MNATGTFSGVPPPQPINDTLFIMALILAGIAALGTFIFYMWKHWRDKWF